MSKPTTNDITPRVSITHEEFRQTKDDIDFMISKIKTPTSGQEQYTMKQIVDDLEELKYRFRDWSVENGLATYGTDGTYHEQGPKRGEGSNQGRDGTSHEGHKRGQGSNQRRTMD